MFKMKQSLCLVPFLALVSAIPSVQVQAIRSATSINFAADTPAKNCEPGLIYCLNQIISDLGTASPLLYPPPPQLTPTNPGVEPQNILHQYCDTQFTYDALSCHACTKVPVPLPNCAASPGAWNSAFECKSGQTYEFSVRCERWCEAGMCV
ncbi:hypothetical protein LEMA_P070670.1 [Plenodomus lingam JN3]|uniref:Uncharacterized protein n=1 Tax=Leptosphaeria maculans (strain JN3 / isolate v23.1.3 / race Av1-4-5-6-7-8) TaxID=985895 RepID=E4ZJC8_LEPMJ|nr:hypothetical protein LEMA_P070670.1 [Plenodomus lingam JN3]CBX91559.1 hypothetical protein LEMA_P070670.1 [Plenodomus lingam JN3]